MKTRITLVLLSCLISIATGLVLARKNESGGGSNAAAGSRAEQATLGGGGARQKPLIGLSMDTLKEDRWQHDRDLFVQRVRELGGEVLVNSANGDDVTQISNIESLISNKVDLLVIIPHNGAAMAKGVAKAHEAGIPVLAYDRLITDCDLDLYLTFDNVKVGEMQGKYLADLWAKSAPGTPKRLVRIYGSKSDNNAVLFKEGQDHIIDPLVKSGAVEVVHADWAEDWKPENAKRITNAAITNAGHNIDAILASNDGTAGGAVQALVEEGLAGKVIVTGQDAELTACQRIMAGTQAMTIYKPVQRLAHQAAELSMKLARRQPVIARSSIYNGKIDVPTVLLEVVAVDKTNMRETVIKDGFQPADKISAQ